jgi:hypothetical protein
LMAEKGKEDKGDKGEKADFFGVLVYSSVD